MITRVGGLALLMFGMLALPLAALAGPIGYGVTGSGFLFRFDVDDTATTTAIGGQLPFVPEGIDFRPGTTTLYAIDVGPNTTQLYTIDIDTGAPTPVGAGFPSAGDGYNLLGAQTFGFDFNPSTLQPDSSMRIRFVSSNGSNLRLHSATGLIAATDGTLLYPPDQSPSVDAVAYSNNLPSMGGATTLYDIDFRNDVLAIQNPPNAGTLVEVGPLGVTVDALSGSGFDIFTDPAGMAPDRALAVIRRPDAPINGPFGSYLLYEVNLATGTISNGRLVGTAMDFTGGFAVIPEPSTLLLGLLAATALTPVMLRRRATRR